jgi:hypothetical protein
MKGMVFLLGKMVVDDKQDDCHYTIAQQPRKGYNSAIQTTTTYCAANKI